MTATLRSARLDLISLPPEFLRAVVEHDLMRAEQIIGLSLPDGLLESDDVMLMRLKQLEEDPSFQPWSLRAIALRDRGAVIGHIGCHAAPRTKDLQSHEVGAVEFGYTVYPAFRRKGYAHEASIELMRWAHQVHNVTRFVLSISPENTASQDLAARLGFVRIGSQIDEIDGIEDVLEYRTPTERMYPE